MLLPLQILDKREKMRFFWKRILHILVSTFSILLIFVLFINIGSYSNSQETYIVKGQNEAEAQERKIPNYNLHIRRRSLDEYKGPVSLKSTYEDVGSDYVLKIQKTVPRSNSNWDTDNSRETSITDLFISVKTTKKYHHKRLDVILDTWFTQAADQTYFFTDAPDMKYYRKTRGHLINTNCSQGHNRQDLCCKMGVEYDQFLKSGKRWFCHMDDDTYVNVPRLLDTLQKYNHTKDWYLGKPSLARPIEMMDRDNPGKKIAFWFATGGAGFCLTRSLALKMIPYAGSGKLASVCDKIRLPDDCTLGYIINYLLKKDLTVIRDFHSHLEGLGLLYVQNLHQHVTFSYGPLQVNVVDVPGFDIKKDPTRFLSIHCKLYPYHPRCGEIAR